MPVNVISENVSSKPVPTLAVVLECLGGAALVVAVAIPTIDASLTPAYPTPENPALVIPWATVASCGLGGLVLLAFGGILRGLHKIEMAISAAKDR